MNASSDIQSLKTQVYALKTQLLSKENFNPDLILFQFLKQLIHITRTF